MKFVPKWLLMVMILFAAANIYIFINRNNKFEYIRYSGMQELYPDEPRTSFLNKWNKYNEKFSNVELGQGALLLKEYTGIDTVSDEKEKIKKIAGWLYKSFYQQQGAPDVQLYGLTPIQQYNYLKTHSEGKLWCGHFQRMFGFFCTAAGFKNRYIEIVPVKDSVNAGYHEVNEVYLQGAKKWVMTDVTRNFFLISKNEHALSAAEYFNYRLGEQPESLLVACLAGDSISTKFLQEEKFQPDIYFNKNYFLRYYLNLNLSEVYSPFQKLKRYIFGNPWYEIYSPGLPHSNFFFRIKQFFFFGFLLLLFLFFAIRYKKQIPPGKNMKKESIME